MASLHKDPRKKSPYWYCAYQTPDGARHFRSTKATDKRQARQICGTWAKASALGAKLSPDKARRVIAQGVADILMASGQTLPSATIRDWCKRWLETKTLEAEPRTHERYETCLRRFLEFLGSKAGEDLDALKVNDVLRYRDYVAKRLSATSTNMELKVLRACLNSAQKQDLVEKNVAAKVDILKQRGENKRRGFTLAEVGRVLKRCDEAGGEWRGLVLTGLYTGQRLGDVAGLTWQQVDLDKRCMSFVTSKTGKRLSFYMAKPLAYYLENLSSSDQPDACVFPKAAAMAEKHTGTISTKFYDEILAPAGLVKTRPKAEAKTGGKGRDAKRQTSELSFHSLRHTFTTWLKSAGASNALAQMIVGHDSEVVSRGYTHLNADDTRAAISKLPDVTI
ncbi:MAG: tyrosine-type recombinase/integrase [Verrucomicrobiota bacterium]|jgi:integrase